MISPRLRIAGGDLADRERLIRGGSWCLAALGAAIPVSTAASNILVALVIVLGMISGLYARNWRNLVAHPVTAAALTLFGWLACTLIYTEVPLDQALHGLGKYLDLLFIPLFLPFFTDQRIRRVGFWAFVGANLLVLFVSTGEGLWQLLVHGGITTEPVVFHKRITQGLLLAFTAYGLLLHSERTEGAKRVLWLAMTLLIGMDLFLFTNGRTGQILFLLLIGLFLWQRFRIRGLLFTVLAGCAILAAAYLGSAPFRERVAESIQALRVVQGDAIERNSTALRLSFYPNTLALIAQRPWFGSGIGSFGRVYAAQVQGTPYPATDNPHNSFLLFWTETGIPSLILFGYLLYRQWRSSASLDPFHRQLLQGLVLLVVADSLLNSFMKDSTEGHLYAWFSALLLGPLVGTIRAPGGRTKEEA